MERAWIAQVTWNVMKNVTYARGGLKDHTDRRLQGGCDVQPGLRAIAFAGVCILLLQTSSNTSLTDAITPISVEVGAFAQATELKNIMDLADRSAGGGACHVCTCIVPVE